MDHTHIMNISWGDVEEFVLARDSQSAVHDGNGQNPQSIPWGDFGEVGQARGSQSAECDGNGQNPNKILTASERLSELLKTRIFSDELHAAAVNVLQELDSVKKKNKTLEEKIICLNNSNPLLEQKKEFLENFSRLILCPTRLKFMMESFVKNYMYLQENHDFVINRLPLIEEKLLEARNMETKSRFEETSAFVRQLLHLSLQERADNSFLNIWIRIRGIPYQVQPAFAEIIRNNDLSSAFIQLYHAKNEVDALEIFNQQKCNVWQSRREVISVNDYAALEALSCISADEAMASIRREGIQLIKVEEEYARDNFEIGPSVVKAENMQYKLCRLVLMTSHHPPIVKICLKLRKRWPNDRRSKRLHWYSSAYAKLFDIVSSQDLFGPTFQSPVSDNYLTTQEFQQYIQILEKRCSSDITFVAETFCLP